MITRRHRPPSPAADVALPTAATPRAASTPRAVGVLVTILAVATLTGCGASTPKQRIAEQPDVFDSFPPDVQDKVRRGEVDVGFPRDAVRMAVGKPDRVYTRTDKSGVTNEVWAYTRERRGTRVGVGIGIGGGSGGVRTGGGVGVGTGGGYDTYEYLRVIFEGHNVAAVERTQ